MLKFGGQSFIQKGHLLSKLDAKLVDEAGVSEVLVRRRLFVGRFTAFAPLVTVWIWVGINWWIWVKRSARWRRVIGEPGTQLTMRTFHSGGTASVGGDITSRFAAGRRSV